MKKYLNNKTINETNDSVNENNNENNNMNLDFDLDSNNKLGIDNSKNNTRNNVNHKIKIDETINTKSVINNYLFTFQNENKLLKTVDLSNFKIKKLKLTKCIIHKNIKTYLHPYIIIKINYKTNLNYLYKNEHNEEKEIKNVLVILDIFEKQNHLLHYNTDKSKSLECDLSNQNINDLTLSVHNHLGHLISIPDNQKLDNQIFINLEFN